ncbi:hypothetical protein RPN52_28765 [Pseudomonas putida]
MISKRDAAQSLKNPAGRSTAGSMQLWVEAIKHIQHAAKQATYAEHTSERTQASPDTAKHKLPAHWSWFLCVKPDTAAPTGQGDGLLKDVRPFQYARMSMIPFITGTFLRRGEGS